ncbi:MAG: hypothetical protein RI884_2326 [Pseudomonadota bacterium]|jgi:hypothetical protein
MGCYSGSPLLSSLGAINGCADPAAHGNRRLLDPL